MMVKFEVHTLGCVYWSFRSEHVRLAGSHGASKIGHRYRLVHRAETREERSTVRMGKREEHAIESIVFDLSH
jgi:hypothetical protein